MTTTQILLLALFLLIAYRFVKKSLVAKSVKHYEPEEVRGLMKSTRNHILLDVRTPKEHSDQNIKGSVLIPLYEIKSRANELKKYKDKEIICYCRTGSRSVNAAAKLKKMGFNTANMKGGILRWNAGGR
jgi:rhodanese-related sulfurtransferase